MAGREFARGFQLLRMPLATGSPVTRNLLVKRHNVLESAETGTADRTLFVTHLDNFVTDAQLLKCFMSGFGPVEKVELKSVEKKALRAGQRADHIHIHVNFARIIFKDAASLEKAIGAATGKTFGTTILPPPVGQLKEQLQMGRDLYRDPVELRREVDEWMVNYDELEEEKKKRMRENTVDDDGFTKVVSGITRTSDGVVIRAAKRPSANTGAFAEPIKGAQDPAAREWSTKKRVYEHPDFYRFQLRENRRQELVGHRKQNEVDMEKVLHLRKAKRFKGAQPS